MKNICNDCGGNVVSNYAPRCKPCAFAYRKANPNPEREAQRSAAIVAYWATRSFDELGRRAKKDRVIQEQECKCLWCGIDQIWNGKQLVFQLDHINGDRSNNTRENLRALCPNCHSQTPTFGSRDISAEARVRMIEGAKRGAKTTHAKNSS